LLSAIFGGPKLISKLQPQPVVFLAIWIFLKVYRKAPSWKFVDLSNERIVERKLEFLHELRSDSFVNVTTNGHI
jgi:hypothetical protein